VADRERPPVAAGGLGYLAAAFIGSSFLGLAYIFSSRPFYAFYEHAPRLWGLSPIADQNLGGILMNGEQTLVFLLAIGWSSCGCSTRSSRRGNRAAADSDCSAAVLASARAVQAVPGRRSGCASYLVGDEHAGVAVVVDPPYAIEPCWRRRSGGAALVGVLETHTHADHVSGHGVSRSSTVSRSASIADADATFAHEPLEDGTEVESARSCSARSTRRATGRALLLSR
jgi:hypothetical protein